MDAALAVLIAIVELDWRFRTSSVLIPSVTVSELVALAIAVTALLVGLAGGRSMTLAALSRALNSSPASVLYLTWVPLVAVVGLASGSADTLHALKDMMPASVLLALCLFLPATKSRLGRAEFTLTIVGIGVAGLAIVQALVGGPYLLELGRTVFAKEGWGAWAGPEHPAVGPFRHPNGLAFFLVPAGILAAGRAIDGLSGRVHPPIALLHAACATLAIVALFAATARLGTGALLIGIGLRVILAAMKLDYTPLRALMVLGVFVLALGSLIAAAVGLSIRGQLDLSTGTLAARWLLNVSAFEFMASNPTVLLFGGGWRLFVEMTPGGLQVHNEFLGQVLRFGLIGGLLFVAMLAYGLRGLDLRAWSYALSLCGLCIIMLLEPGDGSQPQGLIMTILGICALRNGAVSDNKRACMSP